MKAFANAALILLLCDSIFAVGPLAVDDLHLTAVNTSRICYPLVNDSDADGDILSLQSFESASTGGGATTDNGDGTLNYSPSAGFVGLDDFGQFASKWLKTGCVDFPPCGGGDLSGDGDVDIEDVLIFCEFWFC